jgi:murein DD-endopeptidase MepM/ murein hydrolase activator NlpD
MTPAIRARTVLLLALVAGAATAASPVAAQSGDADPPPPVGPTWEWPVAGLVLRPYEQPAHAYGAGHRGIDILASGRIVTAPDDGVVVFSGTVADRPLVTIDHGEGIVSTLEPVVAAPAPGTTVRAGDPIGQLTTGGHARPGALHLGAREDGEYINPLRLLAEVPRAVLLPCC